MLTTATRLRRGRFSPDYNWGVFLQFVRDITRDFQLSPRTAAPGTRLYNYLEDDGKLHYWPMRGYRIAGVIGRSKRHA